MPHVLPAPIAIRNLMEDLLGRDVSVKPGDPFTTTAHTLTAIYVDDNLRMACVIGLDLPLAAYSGAALGLMPAGGAQDCIEDKALSPVLAENVSELCNILTGLLNRDGAPHVRLYG